MTIGSLAYNIWIVLCLLADITMMIIIYGVWGQRWNPISAARPNEM